MSLTAAASGFVVFLLSVQVIQAQNGWKMTYTPTQICALKGSTVKMKCTYRYPYRINDRVTTVEETFWFTQMNGDVPMDLRTDLRYAGRLQYRCSNKVCTLTITDLRESDSAEYKFRVITNQPDGSFLGSPGVTLSVTGLNVQVGRHFHYASPELLCHSSCSLRDHPFYVWYKNGKYILRKQSYSVDFDSADSYSCAIKGHEDFRSPSVYAPKFPSVSVSPSAEIVEGRSVTLTCSSDANPAAKYTWYKENGYPNFNPLSKESQFVFSSIQSSDSGEYYCAAENELGRRTSSKYIVNVKYAPKTSSVTASPSGKIMEGSSVILTCSSDANPTATNTWYKKNQSQPQGLQGIYHFNSISPEDSGIYYCKSENQYGQLCSTSLSIDVHYAPKLPSVSASPSAEIVEGSSLTLTCSSDAYPAAKFTWYKENQTLIQGPEDIYYFTSVSVEDSGIYHCKSENEFGQISSTSVSIDVQYAPKLPSVSVSPSAEIVKGSSVNLTCSSDANPAATYTWYKENEDSPKASGQIFTVTDIRPEHSGNYYCEAQNTRGRHNSTLHLIVVAGSLKSAAGSITAIFLALIFLCAFLFIRRKRSSKQTTAPGERPDNAAQLNMSSVCNNPSAAAQRTPAESDGLCYASVSFSKHQEDPLYSNVRTAQPNRHKNEEEEDEDGVEYSVVNFKSASASAELRRQEAVEEDSSSLYSTVTKKPRL